MRWPRLPLVAVAAIVGAGSVARVVAHRGVAYSPADELVYARQSCALATDGPSAYAGLVRDYLADAGAQLYPAPTRWAFLVPDSLASRLLGCGQSSVAWVSILAGIAMLVLVAAFTSRRFDPWVSVLAVAFVASSPLQLLIGRRALGDELVGVVSLAALWAVLAYVERRSWRRWLLVVALVTGGFATKEVFVVLYPALLAPLVLRWLRDRRAEVRDVLALLLPPLVNAAVLAVLARDPDASLQMVRAVQASAGSPYAEQYLAGPPYRLVVDLLVLAPVVVLLAVAAFGMLPDRGTPSSRSVGLLLVLSLLPFGFVGVQLVRLVVVSDSLIAVLAAWGVLALLRGRVRWALLVGAGAVAVNTWVFWVISVRHEIYDPTTYDLLRALGFLPS
jgi:4-amino-4-deoxy-L-arabinose transferase-like glycosyltransferase